MGNDLLQKKKKTYKLSFNKSSQKMWERDAAKVFHRRVTKHSFGLKGTLLGLWLIYFGQVGTGFFLMQGIFDMRLWVAIDALYHT